MSNFVVDASILLAILNQESGAEEAEGLIEAGCFISAVNLVEVVTKLQDGGNSETDIENQLLGFDIETVGFSRSQAMDAGFLRNLTRFKGLSLGDRACLALAREMRLPAITADRQWQRIDVGVEIRFIR